MSIDAKDKALTILQHYSTTPYIVGQHSKSFRVNWQSSHAPPLMLLRKSANDLLTTGRTELVALPKPCLTILA